jgi:hypothetical protein
VVAKAEAISGKAGKYISIASGVIAITAASNITCHSEGETNFMTNLREGAS